MHMDFLALFLWPSQPSHTSLQLSASASSFLWGRNRISCRLFFSSYWTADKKQWRWIQTYQPKYEQHYTWWVLGYLDLCCDNVSLHAWRSKAPAGTWGPHTCSTCTSAPHQNPESRFSSTGTPVPVGLSPELPLVTSRRNSYKWSHTPSRVINSESTETKLDFSVSATVQHFTNFSTFYQPSNSLPTSRHGCHISGAGPGQRLYQGDPR